MVPAMSLAARSPGARVGRQALALVALLIASQLAASAHFLLFSHTNCPVDGQLVDIPRGSGRSDLDLAAHDRNTVDRASQPADVSSDHDHCLLVLHRQDPRLLPPASAREWSGPILVVPMPAGALVVGPGIVAVYRTSPKQSPPV